MIILLQRTLNPLVNVIMARKPNVGVLEQVQMKKHNHINIKRIIEGSK